MDALRFVVVGIYWTNHHHMLHATARINGAILWANLHLLFWLSLVPFVTGWMGETDLARVPTAVYGIVLLLAAFAWQILQRAITSDRANSKLAAAMRKDLKGNLSGAIYVLSGVLAL